MKKILSFILVGFLFFSCDSFLEEESQDQVIPKSAKDFKEYLFGEAYLGHTTPPDYYLDMMSDDVEEFTYKYGSDYRLDFYGYYAWQKEPEEGLGDELEIDKAWGKYYHQILMANIVLDLIENAEGTDAEKADVKGEAYFIRANAYFMLVNLYGEPYTKETAASAMGVPINDNIGVKDMIFKRSSVETVYNKIVEDIENSIKYLKEANQYKTVFRISEAAANVLASRIYLYKKEWDNAIKCANRAIVLKPALCDLNTYESRDLIMSSNPEIIFTYGANTTSHVYNKYGKGTFAASKSLIDLYKGNDLRKAKYFYTYRTFFKPIKGFTFTNDLYDFALRSSEAYLNRAEAYAEKGAAADITLAVSDINKIRENRFSPKVDGDDETVDIQIAASTKEKAIELVRSERRRELCFEQQRWFDLRRWGMPRIEHVWTTDFSAGTKVTYVLEQGDAAYTLPVPKDVRLSNSDIKNVDRSERQGSN